MPTSKGGGVVVAIGCLLLLVRWELSTLQRFLLLRVVSTTYSLIFLLKVSGVLVVSVYGSDWLCVGINNFKLVFK